jgi:enterochelin esterase-like enzyme
MPTRRQALLGAAASITALAGASVGLIQLAEAGLVPGKSAVDEQLGYCDVAVRPARHAAGEITTGSFASARRRRTVDYAIAYPPGVPAETGLPVCLVLHGYGADASLALAAGNYPGYLADAVAAGTPPFALAAASGGHGYWHPHADDDPLGMLLNEFLPRLAQHRLGVDRPAVLGYSMGGFGALLCGLAAPGRFASIVASSPAFWRSCDEAEHVNPEAFASKSDWDRYGDLLSQAARISRLPAHIDVGAADSFTPAIRTLRDRLADPDVVHVAKGCHDNPYWRSQAPAQLRLVGAALASI